MDMGHTLVTSNGPWNNTLELVLRDCHSHPGQPTALKHGDFLLRKLGGYLIFRGEGTISRLTALYEVLYICPGFG